MNHKYATTVHKEARESRRVPPAHKCRLLGTIPEGRGVNHVSRRVAVSFGSRLVAYEIQQRGRKSSCFGLRKNKSVRPERKGELRVSAHSTYDGLCAQLQYQMAKQCFSDEEKLPSAIRLTMILDLGFTTQEITPSNWGLVKQQLASVDAKLRVQFEVLEEQKALGDAGKRLQRFVEAIKGRSKLFRRRAEKETLLNEKEAEKAKAVFDHDWPLREKKHRNRAGRLLDFGWPY